MIRTQFALAFLVSLAVLTSGAVAQQRNEVTGIVGRTFVSDQGVIGVVAADNNLHSGNGITFEANYGWRLMDLGIVGLTSRCPLSSISSRTCTST